MRRITFRLSVAVLTFAIGVMGVCLTGLYPRIEDFVVDKLIVRLDLNPNVQPRFKPTSRGCSRPGYIQRYKLPDGRSMSEGSLCDDSAPLVKEEIQSLISKASRIVERVPTFKNRSGEEGERIVLIYPPDEQGKEEASILWYGGDNCSLYIDAPSLDLALEFEKANAYAY
jgi:hypothetical protein